MADHASAIKPAEGAKKLRWVASLRYRSGCLTPVPHEFYLATFGVYLATFGVYLATFKRHLVPVTSKP